MKNLITLIFCAFLTLNCSRNSGTDDTGQQDQLPAATQIGANTAGCLVNGKVLLPRGQKIQSGPVLASQYQFLNGGFHFGLNIQDNSNNILKSVGIGSDNLNFEVGKTYVLEENLNNNTQIKAYAHYVNYDIGYYKTSNNVLGEIKITNLNTNNNIISGTFWYDAVNANGEKVEIREGRFDVHYAP
ncbi:DUF6252 family protein [Frigoriflavimonas asaccharolytica]|uniref:Uncharacterized protein n=1 Tax=Frigoriflavimonas asaccharolytica TaxID=2735899 RepID=A0A8J8K7P7_9FLAO|nr:DUF6252 family protein [Frigoriflavimonas asaccharolytica]NRS91681.1 hypothetical protein [Frigoriflavimonas asaccharolytica]